MLASVRVLRATAALLVVLYHVQIMLASRPEQVSNLGASGVDVFFVISGFIMMYGQYDNFQSPGASKWFIRNRIIRIVPLYYLFTTLSIFILLVLPSLYANLRFDLKQAIFSYLFLFSTNSAGQAGMIVGVAWTLAYEMFFYVLFTILLRYPRKYAVPGLFGIFLFGNVFTFALGLNQAILTVFSHTITFEFIFGCIIALAVRRRLTPPLVVSFVLVGLGVLGLVLTSSFGLLVNYDDNTRFLVYGVPAAALVGGAVFLESAGLRVLRAPRWLLLVGDSSYSLYLAHEYALAIFAVAILPLGVKLGVPPLVTGTFAALLCVLVGFTCYSLFERPAASYLGRWRRRTRVQGNETQTT